MPSASIQARTAVRIGVLSTPPQSVITPRNSPPLSTPVILGVSGALAGEMSLARDITGAAGTWWNAARHGGARPMKRSPDLEGGTMPDLSSLRLVKVPSTAPPYDCELHVAGCPAGADSVPGGEEAPAAPLLPVAPAAAVSPTAAVSPAAAVS